MPCPPTACNFYVLNFAPLACISCNRISVTYDLHSLYPCLSLHSQYSTSFIYQLVFFRSCIFSLVFHILQLLLPSLISLYSAAITSLTQYPTYTVQLKFSLFWVVRQRRPIFDMSGQILGRNFPKKSAEFKVFLCL